VNLGPTDSENTRRSFSRRGAGDKIKVVLRSQDLNCHTLRHYHLKVACLPILTICETGE